MWECKAGYEGRELRRREGKGEFQPCVTPIYPASQHATVTANVLIKHFSKITVTRLGLEMGQQAGTPATKTDTLGLSSMVQMGEGENQLPKVLL